MVLGDIPGFRTNICGRVITQILIRTLSNTFQYYTGAIRKQLKTSDRCKNYQKLSKTNQNNQKTCKPSRSQTLDPLVRICRLARRRPRKQRKASTRSLRPWQQDAATLRSGQNWNQSQADLEQDIRIEKTWTKPLPMNPSTKSSERVPDPALGYLCVCHKWRSWQA